MNTTVIAVIAAFALGFASAWGIQGLRWDNDVAQIRLEASEAQGEASEKARAQEALWQENIEGIQRNAQSQIESMQVAASAADAAGDSVRESANAYAAKATCSSSPDSGGASARRAAMVLSDLFGRADKRAGQLAEYADRLKVALTACNAAYQSLRN